MSVLESVVVSDNEIVVITYILGFKNVVTDRYDENKMPIMEKVPIKEKTVIPFEVFKSVLKGFPVRECQRFTDNGLCRKLTTKKYIMVGNRFELYLCDDHNYDDTVI